MAGGNKVLTVSYGAFSCTLEGFDDSFATMKAIAEYFRSLSAQDRYFGAVPPTPDPQTLQRIAETELRRRVEARLDDGTVFLRPTEEPAFEYARTEPSMAAPGGAVARPQAQQPTPRPGDSDGDGTESAAARVARLRAAVLKSRAAQEERLPSIFDDSFPDADDTPSRALPGAGLVAEAGRPQPSLDGTDSLVHPLPTREEDPDRAVTSQSSDESDTTRSAPGKGVESSPTAGEGWDDGAGPDADPDTAPGPATDSVPEARPAPPPAAAEDTPPPTPPSDRAPPPEADSAATEARDGHEKPVSAYAAGPNSLFRRYRGAPSRSSAQDQDTSVEKRLRAFLNRAREEHGQGPAQTAARPAPQPTEAPPADPVAAPDAQDPPVAPPKAEAPAPEAPKPEAAGAKAPDAEPPAPRVSPFGAVDPDSPDAEADRLDQSARSLLGVAENRRRLASFSAMKAAVAATEAEREAAEAMEGIGTPEDADPVNRYRDDLSQAVGGMLAQRQRAPVLVLGASERVDPGSFLPGGRPTMSTASSPSISFRKFHETLDVTEIEDTFEAAAVYLSAIEGLPTFSRQQMLRKVGEVVDMNTVGRETVLRCFGVLIREGRIVRMGDGDFTIPDGSAMAQSAREAHR